MEWRKEAVTTLIKAYEEERSLIDTEHPQYHNKHARRERLEEVARKVAEVSAEVTAEDCKAKSLTLRSHYGAELKKIKESEKSGASGANVYHSKVWWFPLMSFLRDYISPRQGRSNIPASVFSHNIAKQCEVNNVQMLKVPVHAPAIIEETAVIEFLHVSSNAEGQPCMEMLVEGSEDTMNGSDIVVVACNQQAASTSTQQEPSTSTPTNRKRKNDSGSGLLATVLENINSKMSQPEPTINDSLLHYVSMELNKIPDEAIVMEAKHKIMKTLMDAQLQYASKNK